MRERIAQCRQSHANRIYLPRHTDLTRIFDAACSMDCLAVVGVSNLGKSATLPRFV